MEILIAIIAGLSVLTFALLKNILSLKKVVSSQKQQIKNQAYAVSNLRAHFDRFSNVLEPYLDECNQRKQQLEKY